MKMVLQITFLAALILTISACNPENTVIEKNDTIIDLRAYFLKSQDSLPFLNLKINEREEDVFNKVNRFTGEKCKDYLAFNTKIENDTITVLARQNCQIFCGINYELSFLVLNDNQIFLDYEEVSLDKLQNSILKQLNSNERYSNRIGFRIYNRDDNSLVSKIIYHKIINTYLIYLDQTSLKKFFKHLTELDQFQLAYLKERYQLHLNYIKRFEPPRIIVPKI